jgi:hypothetical protein
MMSRRIRVVVLAALGGPWVAGCGPIEAASADPEATQLDPPVVVVDEPEPEPAPEPEPVQTAASPTPVPTDPNTEVITFTGSDATPGMADEISGTPKRDPLPSMMSDVIHGPNK